MEQHEKHRDAKLDLPKIPTLNLNAGILILREDQNKSNIIFVLIIRLFCSDEDYSPVFQYISQSF